MRDTRESHEHGWISKWEPVSRIPTFGKLVCSFLAMHLWQGNKIHFKSYTRKAVLLSNLHSFSSPLKDHLLLQPLNHTPYCYKMRLYFHRNYKTNPTYCQKKKLIVLNYTNILFFKTKGKKKANIQVKYIIECFRSDWNQCLRWMSFWEPTEVLL